MSIENEREIEEERGCVCVCGKVRGGHGGDIVEEICS